MRRGDFSSLLSASNPFYRREVRVRDPLLSGLCQPTPANPTSGVDYQAACFPGNIIPAARLSKNGSALLNAYPAPVPGYQQGTNNFIQQRPAETDQRKDTISIDWNPSEKHQVRGRISNFNYIDTAAFRTNTDRAPQIIDRPNNTASIAWTWTISPTKINEFLATASADRVHIYVDTRGDRYKRSIYGIDYPYVFSDPKEIQDKIPTVHFNSSTFVTDLDGGPYPSASSGPIYDFSDNFTMIRGNHTFKVGGLFERAGQNDFDQINVAGVPGGTNNQNGRFEFDNTRSGGSGVDLADAALGLFSSYAEIGVRSYTPYRGHMYEWFVQDSWKIRSNLRLELGLRHSIIQPYYSLWRNMVVFDPKLYDPSKAAVMDPGSGFILSGDQYNGLVIPGDGFPESAKGRVPVATSGQFDRLFRGVPKEFSQIHKKDFQPRMGIAYSFNEKTVIRAGAGRFMTRLGVSDSVFLGGNPPLQPMVSISNGRVDSPGGGSARAFPFNVTTQDQIFPNPTAWTWNATFERELPFRTTLEVGYVGRKGLNGQRERNINQLVPGTRQANPGINPDALRPFKGFGPIRITNNDANSIYHGLQVGVNRRFSGGFSYGVAYTLAKSSDDGSAQRDIIPNNYDRTQLWGASDYDNRHTMVINYIYELPWLKGQSSLAGKVLGGWQITGVTQFQTGIPVTIRTGDDFAGVGSGSGQQIWNVNGDYKLSRGEQKFSQATADSNFWFRTTNSDKTSIFTAPAAGTFTTQLNRNLIYGPGFQNWNAGIFKTYKFTESQNIQFRFEAFNWINHPNLGGENGSSNTAGIDINPRSGTFGKVFTKGGERRLQLSLRYSF